MRVAANGTEIYIDVDGPQLKLAAGRLRSHHTLIALHGGFGFDQGYLRAGLASLSHLAQVVYLDLRCQGRSAIAEIQTCTLEQMADDVAAVCGVLGIERPVVFGHSAGGFVALHLALRHPALVGGLILCNTSPTMVQVADDGPPAPSLTERAGAEAAGVAARLFGGDMSQETLEAFNRLVLPFYGGPLHMEVPGRVMALSDFKADVARYFFGELAGGYDLRPRLGEIVVPTLVVIGRYDWVCSPAAGRAIAAGIAKAELMEFADSGHKGADVSTACGAVACGCAAVLAATPSI